MFTKYNIILIFGSQWVSSEITLLQTSHISSKNFLLWRVFKVQWSLRYDERWRRGMVGIRLGSTFVFKPKSNSYIWKAW